MLPINRKVSSFSLIEMLVVMLLSTIIISIVYFSYYNVARYQIDLTNKFSRMSDLSTSYFLLKTDFDRSKTIKAETDRSLRFFIPNRGQNILYEFNPSYLVRRHGARIDTFKCECDKPNFLWKDKILEEIPGWVDELKMGVNTTGTVFSVRKNYDAASLLETVKYDTL